MMNKRRLLKLAEFLETAEIDGEFKMSAGETGWAEDFNKNGTPVCGSAACAAGWATTIPSFRRAGLHLQRTPSGGVEPAFAHHTAFSAVQRFFGLQDDAAHIFWPNDMKYLTGECGRRIVAKRIRKLVEGATSRASLREGRRR